MCVFLKERLMLDRVSDDVLEHDLRHGKNLLLGVGRVMLQVGGLITAHISLMQGRMRDQNHTQSSRPKQSRASHKAAAERCEGT